MLEMFLYVLVGNYHRKNPRLNCVKGELTQFKVEVTILQEFTALKKLVYAAVPHFIEKMIVG